MNDIKKFKYLKEFKQQSIEINKLLYNDTIKVLFVSNEKFNNLIKQILKFWLGHFNSLKQEYNDENFYLEFEDYYKNSIIWILNELKSNKNYEIIKINEIFTWDENTNLEYHDLFSKIKKEYGSIFNKPLKLEDIEFLFENKKELIDEIDDKKEKLRKLSTKEKFKIIKKEKFYKETIKKFIKLHIIIRNKEYKRKETEKILKYFLIGYNEFFCSNINLATTSKEFRHEFFNNLDNKGFTWAIRIWIAIVSIPILVALLAIVLVSTINFK